VRRPILRLLVAVSTIIAGFFQSYATSLAADKTPKAQVIVPAQLANKSTKEKKVSSKYISPTEEEMAPMRPEYLATLAKVHEPPEMADKPMQVRRDLSPGMVKNMEKLGNAINSVSSPEKATHKQRAAAVKELLAITTSKDLDEIGSPMVYGAIALIACFDGAEPQKVIGYTNNALADGDDALALRARMYLKIGDRVKALDDLEKIVVDDERLSLAGGGVDPRMKSTPCGWSIADFDALGDAPRALAAKGFYLSSFLPFGARDRGVVNESDIRELYIRSAKAWHSPIPHILMATTLNGPGSAQYTNMAGCIRTNYGGTVESTVRTCAEYDEGTRQAIRDLTMALVIDPSSARALSERASKHLELAQAYYADGKPSRQLFELAIDDFSAAIAAGGKNLHTLYCDRALTLASIGRYQEAAIGYVQGMKSAEDGIEKNLFVYRQLAGVYMKMGKFNEAANVINQAISNLDGGSMVSVIFDGGIKAFRALYPEYDLVPDEILAEAVRRRYFPQFPQTWDVDFISNGGRNNGKIITTLLPELYAIRGDAYMRAGRSAEALADYRRVKSNVWYGEERFMPRYRYFNEQGDRDYDLPEPWPAPPPRL